MIALSTLGFAEMALILLISLYVGAFFCIGGKIIGNLGLIQSGIIWGSIYMNIVIFLMLLRTEWDAAIFIWASFLLTLIIIFLKVGAMLREKLSSSIFLE